ncbi:MAG TPA: cation diffusion facilitator family transporter [Caulobacteraceae bacterium]
MGAIDNNRARTAALTRRVTLLSMAMAAGLAALKLVVWLASGSVALMASMADSGLDLIASTATFIAVRYAAAPPDAEHRFGHGKAEAFASLIQAGLVFASAALVGQEAIRRVIHPAPVAREGWAIAIMLTSTVFTAGLIAAQTRLLRRAQSVAVSSDRTHYAADLASNLIALVGIAAAAVFGLPRMDALAGLGVTVILLWGAVSVFRKAADQLMDHELADEARARIVDLMMQDRRITDVHQLRTRAAGPTVHVQLHADMDPDLTLDVAHQVLIAAEKRVLAAFPGADIIIHADPRGRAEPHGGEFAPVSPG